MAIGHCCTGKTKRQRAKLHGITQVYNRANWSCHPFHHSMACMVTVPAVDANVLAKGFG